MIPNLMKFIPTFTRGLRCNCGHKPYFVDEEMSYGLYRWMGIICDCGRRVRIKPKQEPKYGEIPSLEFPYPDFNGVVKRWWELVVFKAE